MFELLVQTIAPRSRLVRTWPLEGGISAQMTALEVEDPAGRRRKYILRQPGEAALAQNPRAARDEFQVLQIARAAGLAAPAPCLLDGSGQIFPAPYLVVEYIEGRMDFAPQDPAPQDPAGTGRPTAVAQMAAQLARIHRVDGARHDLSFLAKPAAGFDEMFGRLPAAVDPAFDGWRLRETLQAAWPFPRQNGAALLHGDYWPGNILWHDGSLAAVLDWEDAALGEPLTDLAIARLDLLWIFGPEAMHAFTRHYLASNPIDTAALPHWDLAAAWRLARMAGADLAGWAAFFAPFGRPDITASSILEHYRDFVRQAQEVLMA